MAVRGPFRVAFGDVFPFGAPHVLARRVTAWAFMPVAARP